MYTGCLSSFSCALGVGEEYIAFCYPSVDTGVRKSVARLLFSFFDGGNMTLGYFKRNWLLSHNGYVSSMVFHYLDFFFWSCCKLTHHTSIFSQIHWNLILPSTQYFQNIVKSLIVCLKFIFCHLTCLHNVGVVLEFCGGDLHTKLLFLKISYDYKQRQAIFLLSYVRKHGILYVIE